MPENWRDAGSSDRDVTPGRRRRRPPVPGVLCLTPESVARAMDDFPSEGPSPEAPSPEPGRLLVRRPVEPAVPPAPVEDGRGGGPIVSLEPLRETLAVLQVTRREAAAVGAVALLSVMFIFIAWSAISSDVPDRPGPAAPVSPTLLVTAQSTPVPGERALVASAGARPAAAPPLATPAPASTLASSPPQRSTPQSPTAQGPAARNATAQASPRSDAPARGAPEPAQRPAAQPQPPAARQALRRDAAAIAPAPLAVVREPAVTLTSPAPAESLQPAAPPLVGTRATPLTDQQAIDLVLGQYRAAFNRLDASAAKAVWPNVDAAALQRVFGQLQSQDLSFSQCSVSLTGVTAVAQCSGNLAYVPSVGSRNARTEYRQWDFNLRQVRGQWQIVRVTSR